MPRLTPRLLRQAWAVDPLLPLLLRPCREIHDAQNELRWLREFVRDTTQPQPTSSASRAKQLRQLCYKRSLGRPLQYILGNQPFGDLDIQCRPGVLIPRPETESYTTFLARYLEQSPSLIRESGLRILDLCTGSGCIALLLHSLLYKCYSDLQIQGVDISGIALRLSRDNLKHNVRGGLLDQTALHQVEICEKNVLKDRPDSYGKWDIVVSNPPYVSHQSFVKDTSRSARLFEPHLALIPDARPEMDSSGVDLSGDVCYPRIESIARSAGAQMVVMEVADEAQARRVIRSVHRHDGAGYWASAAIWHDNLYNADPRHAARPWSDLDSVIHVGNGNARAVVLVHESEQR